MFYLTTHSAHFNTVILRQTYGKSCAGVSNIRSFTYGKGPLR